MGGLRMGGASKKRNLHYAWVALGTEAHGSPCRQRALAIAMKFVRKG